jgi:predicted component of type VI protein secretion system
VGRDPGSRPSTGPFLRDRKESLNVSREHFLIDRGDTAYILVDQAGTCGTIDEGQSVGGHARGGSISLHDGEVIIVGTSLARASSISGSADAWRASSVTSRK